MSGPTNPGPTRDIGVWGTHLNYRLDRRSPLRQTSIKETGGGVSGEFLEIGESVAGSEARFFQEG